jgi:hypothetical protein
MLAHGDRFGFLAGLCALMRANNNGFGFIFLHAIIYFPE